MKKEDQSKIDGRLPSYGGQALIEGVMMRGSHALSAAMRAPDGKIIVHTEVLGGIHTSKWVKVPFIRGLVILWDSLGLGMKYLTMSANLQSGEEEKIDGKDLFFTLMISMLIAITLFFAAPALFGSLIEKYLNISSFLSNIIEGIIRLAAIIGYIWSVGKIPEIGRVFAYHGAEHKTINAFENDANLAPDTVSKYSLEHPRCGTAFLLTLVVFSIIVFTLIGPLPFFLKMVSRIILIPVLAGIAYEYLRITARNINRPLMRIFLKPNLALQKLTTREPDLAMVEVAITAFQAMFELEKKLIAQQSKNLGVETVNYHRPT